MKLPICKVCKNPFERKYTSTQRTCNIECSMIDVTRTQEAKAARDKEKQRKADRRLLRARKDAIKPISHWLGLAQTACNAYIRKRDESDGCISCNKPSTWGGQWHGSHYRPAGNCSPLRFHPMNIHKACSECNNFKSGNLSEFRIKLIGKIGLDMVEFLESQNQPYKWDIDDVNDIKQYYRNQTKLLD